MTAILGWLHRLFRPAPYVREHDPVWRALRGARADAIAQTRTANREARAIRGNFYADTVTGQRKDGAR